MQLLLSLLGFILLLAILIFVFYQYLYGPSPRNFNKTMAGLDSSVKDIPFFRNIKKLDQRHYEVKFAYGKKDFILDCNLESKSSYNPSSHSKDMSYRQEFAYYLLFDESKPLSRLELSRLSGAMKIIGYIIPSTANISGNEDRGFRVIYEYSGRIGKEVLKKIIEQIVSVNLLTHAKNIPYLDKIIVEPEKATIQTYRPIENTEKLEDVFDLLIELAAAKVSKIEIQRNPDELNALKLIKAILSDINTHSISDDVLYSEAFIRKFRLLLEEVKSEEKKTGVKIMVSISSVPQVRIHETNRDTLKATIIDSFPIKSVPFVREYENPSDEKSHWELLIDKNTGKLVGMTEDIWGQYKV